MKNDKKELYVIIERSFEDGEHDLKTVNRTLGECYATFDEICHKLYDMTFDKMSIRGRKLFDGVIERFVMEIDKKPLFKLDPQGIVITFFGHFGIGEMLGVFYEVAKKQ